jgi:hypothetical protein
LLLLGPLPRCFFLRPLHGHLLCALLVGGACLRLTLLLGLALLSSPLGGLLLGALLCRLLLRSCLSLLPLLRSLLLGTLLCRLLLCT